MTVCAKSNRPSSSSISARVASMRARIQRSSSSRGRASGCASAVLMRISRATFHSLFVSRRPSSIALYEKRTSCADEIFNSP